MNDVVIRCEKLGKIYRIGERYRYRTLRDTIADAFSIRKKQAQLRYIWALKEVSFEIKRGTVLGIVGRNGAGKTTLLKVLSRITSPTEGFAEIEGRVGSLLEVGTGFHPELTGRDNIYLNAAILGMGKRETGRKFNDIVSFAELEQFIDTPVKRYSSGMYVRLAFSVAAHLEPDILFVDEVLSVGDLAFQKKCLGKMDEVPRSGRTIIFVSHQMNQIRRLCQRVIWIDNGTIRADGPTPEIISSYEAAMSSGEWQQKLHSDVSQSDTRFLHWEIVNPHSGNPHVLDVSGPLTIKFVVRLSRDMRLGSHGIALCNNEGQVIWATATDNLAIPAGAQEFIYSLPTLPLKPGMYNWRVSLYDETGLLDDWSCIPELLVSTQPVTHPSDAWTGILNIPYEFSIKSSEGG